MPSKRRQMNIRVDEETRAEMERLKNAVTLAAGIEASHSDVIRLAIKELALKYPAADKAKKK